MSYTCHASYTTIAAGTTIAVHAMNGNELLSWMCKVNTEMKTMSLALSIIVGKELQVPQQSVHLVWETACDVLYTVSQVDQDLVDDDMMLSGDQINLCYICYDPCETIDGFLNCHECVRPGICPHCRIQIWDGTWRCFDCMIFCIKSFGGLDIPAATLKRFELVNPKEFHELSGSKVCLD